MNEQTDNQPFLLSVVHAGEPSMKPAINELQSSPYNMLKRHMTADLVAVVYGTPEQRVQTSKVADSTAGVSSAAVLTVLRQLAHLRVGVIEVDCDARMADSTGAWPRWQKGAHHDTCVGEDLLE